MLRSLALIVIAQVVLTAFFVNAVLVLAMLLHYLETPADSLNLLAPTSTTSGTIQGGENSSIGNWQSSRVAAITGDVDPVPPPRQAAPLPSDNWPESPRLATPPVPPIPYVGLLAESERTSAPHLSSSTLLDQQFSISSATTTSIPLDDEQFRNHLFECTKGRIDPSLLRYLKPLPRSGTIQTNKSFFSTLKELVRLFENYPYNFTAHANVKLISGRATISLYHEDEDPVHILEVKRINAFWYRRNRIRCMINILPSQFVESDDNPDGTTSGFCRQAVMQTLHINFTP